MKFRVFERLPLTSNNFKKQGAIKWLRWLFLEEEKEAGNCHGLCWNLSSDRHKLLLNEAKPPNLILKIMVENYKADLNNVYSELTVLVEELNKVSLTDFNSKLHFSTLVSAFTKCFEYNLDINRLEDDNYSFYFMAFLRGLCEDLISLKFIDGLPIEKREKVTSSYVQYLVLTSIKTQHEFFQKERPFQPVISSKNIDGQIKNQENCLKAIWEELGYKKNKIFPSVEHMAIYSKLILLYNFLYHATSRTVHFSPNVLLRRGWYKKEEEIIRFTNNNFSKYYSLFNSHYGTYLFIHFIKAFRKKMNLQKGFTKAVAKLEEIQKNLVFFPEIITYEELNLSRPTNFDYLTLKLTSTMTQAEKEKFENAIQNVVKEINDPSILYALSTK